MAEAEDSSKLDTDDDRMNEIELSPEHSSPKARQLISSPPSETHSISIRDYMKLNSPDVRVNRKATNRIMGNRKRPPSEVERSKKRKKALAEIYDIVTEQEEENPTPLDSKTITTCQYKGKTIPYKKRSTKG